MNFRKRCTIIGLTIGNLAGLMLRFMPTWWSFLIFWMVMHTFNHLAYIAASVYVVEVVGPSKRHYGQIMSIGFGIGYVLSSPIAFGFPHWKNFTTAFAITSIPVIIILAFLPQSPRWVYADGRPHDGLEILKSFERWTKATLPDNLDNEIRETGDTDGDTVNSKTLTIADVFKSFHLRKIALLMGFAFIAVTIAYYGLAYNAAALPGDLYVNNAINGAVETLAYILLMFSMPYIGRKWLTSSTFLLGGGVCILCAILLETSNGRQAMRDAAQWLSFVGKFFVSGCFG